MNRIELEEVVQYYDTDCGGVVSNIAYLRWIERARSALFAGLGLPLAETMERMLFPAVARTEIDYRRPARLGEIIRTVADVERCEKVRIHCRFQIEAAGADACSAPFVEARQVVVLVRMPSGRPARVPAEWRDAFPST